MDGVALTAASNAAMIAFAALLHAFEGKFSPLDGDIDPNLKLAASL